MAAAGTVEPVDALEDDCLYLHASWPFLPPDQLCLHRFKKASQRMRCHNKYPCHSLTAASRKPPASSDNRKSNIGCRDWNEKGSLPADYGGVQLYPTPGSPQITRPLFILSLTGNSVVGDDTIWVGHRPRPAIGIMLGLGCHMAKRIDHREHVSSRIV